MGAEIFHTIARGSSVQEAFVNAVKQAQYDYDHAGYTGTVAEKESLTVISDEPHTLVEAHALADDMTGRGDARIDDTWGPAGAIRIDDVTWLFFGWASS